ncbi:hypothetical protein H5410_046331 [Solanum commersonii]|uniref:DUF4283 domain-containing protein n=1 Tax=Solanum commersonii TaxID=4109 RepID=A0A9J5XBZ0_SOLCO|nr:hypothetical protein H5410_046331 [Solanum commersonii]
MNAAKTHRQGNSLVISDEAGRTQYELLARCVVGNLPGEIPNVILSEIRQWSKSTWKHLHGVNIYEMGRNQFLFELPTKKDADHIVKGIWFWKNHKFQLNWWSSTSNAITENLKQVWIRLVGLPLQFWSQKILQEIGDLCGGWIQTEETELRNHLKWARLKVKGDEISVPKVDRVRKEIGALNIEEVIPLNSTDLTDNMDPDNHSNVSFWVRQNVLKLAEEFGVHVNSSEELAEELFMKIDGKRQNPIEVVKALISLTPKSNGSKKLKRLESGNNFFSHGTRSGGDIPLSNLMNVNIISWNVRGLNDARKRLLIKSLLHNWKADVSSFRRRNFKGI